MINKSLFTACFVFFLGQLGMPICAQNTHSKAPQADADFIVAVVNSIPITRSDIKIRQARLVGQWTTQGTPIPTETELYGQVLNQLIDERVILNLAHDLAMKVSPDLMTETLLGLAIQNQLNNVAEFQIQYEKSGRNWRAYNDEIRDQLLIQQVREREVANRVRVSEDDITTAMNEPALVGTRVNRFNIAQILIALPENPSTVDINSAQNKAIAVVAKARSGDDFAKLAAAHSDAANAAKDGGIMGLRSSDRYPELFVQAARNLPINAVSDPIRSDAGFHILKLLQRLSQTIETTQQTRVRHILLTPTNALNEGQAKARLMALRGKIELKQDTFESVAKEHSVDSSAAQGGNLDWALPGQFVPEFEQVMNNLAIGKLSMPFTSRFGVHILEVMERREVALSESEQRERMAERVRTKKVSQAYQLWLTDLRNRAFVEYRNQ